MGGSLALILVIVLTLAWLAEAIAERIPFSYEQEIAGEFAADAPEDPLEAAAEQRLQEIADDLARNMDLPPDMSIRVHYSDADTVNAFATLGGHIVIFRGLIEQMPNENTLAMVLAHEIAHIKHRHPIVGLGRGVVVGLALAVIAGVSGSDLTDRVLGSAGMLTAMSFSRAQEREADRSGLAAVAARYGHVNGSQDLFEIFHELEREQPLRPPEFMNSHPDSGHRKQNIADLAADYGWSLQGDVTPLSIVLKKVTSSAISAD